MARQDDSEFDLLDPLGCDVLVSDDIDAAHRLESGLSLLAHDVFWRWMTPRGRLLDDPDYGFGLIQEVLSQPLGVREISALPRRLEAEARKDERVQSISVTLENTGPNAYRINARGLAVTGKVFNLVAEVSQAYQRIVTAGGA
jgi:hypothetical protein